MWVGYEEFCRSRLGRGSAWVDNTLRDLQNSSYPMKAELNNCFIIIQNISYFLKEKLSSLFFAWAPKITQPDPQVFSVKGSIICSGLHFRYHFDVIGSIICSRLHFWLHWFNVTKTFQIWSTAAGHGELHCMHVVLTDYQSLGNILNEW